MVEKLFQAGPPKEQSTLLDPGCAEGTFLEGVLRWCQRESSPVPRMTGIELDAKHLPAARRAFSGHENISIVQADFLASSPGSFDYIIGNPPYVPITQMTERERAGYRRKYAVARGRFDLYLLFFERALNCLAPHGRLVFITPEKFLYVHTAAELRKLLSQRRIVEIEMVDEQSFGDLVTYPTITTIENLPGPGSTGVVLRNGESRSVRLGKDGASWMPTLNGAPRSHGSATLADISLRVSCGVATGADSVYVVDASELPERLRRFAHPTVAGRQISRSGFVVKQSILVPYDRHGRLLPERDLGPLWAYLDERRRTLERRTCAARKAWYAYHDSAPLDEILRPKILCKDIVAEPYFVVDARGDVVPRHSVYYIIPKDTRQLMELAAYLNSPQAHAWLMAHCQRAANGFVRLQSSVLKRLPVPQELVPDKCGLSQPQAIATRTERPLRVFG